MTAIPSEQSRQGSDPAAAIDCIPTVAYDLIYLIGCALHGTAPEQVRVDAMDMDALFALSTSLSLNALAARALDEMPEAERRQGPTRARWQEATTHALRRYFP